MFRATTVADDAVLIHRILANPQADTNRRHDAEIALAVLRMVSSTTSGFDNMGTCDDATSGVVFSSGDGRAEVGSKVQMCIHPGWRVAHPVTLAGSVSVALVLFFDLMMSGEGNDHTP